MIVSMGEGLSRGGVVSCVIHEPAVCILLIPERFTYDPLLAKSLS